MEISGDFINQPGALGKAKKAIVKSKQTFVFHVSSKDIEDELKKFNKLLSKELLKTVKTKRPDSRIYKQAAERLTKKAPRGSPRIQALLQAMKLKNKYSVGEDKAAPLTGKTNKILMQMFDINSLDRETNLGKLDKLFPQPHIAPFAGNPERSLSSQAKAYRSLQKFSLWRMYEYPTAKSYVIPKVSKGPLYYTTANDGYSKWNVIEVGRHVQWSTRGATGVANQAYYLLNSSRQIYKQDKGHFSRAIGSGVSTILRTKTRFN